MKTPDQFLRGGGMLQIEYLAARQAVAREREHWLPILQHWYDDDMMDADDLEERQALYRQIRRLRRLLGMKKISAPDAGEQRRIKTRERVRRYRQRQRLKA